MSIRKRKVPTVVGVLSVLALLVVLTLTAVAIWPMKWTPVGQSEEQSEVIP